MKMYCNHFDSCSAPICPIDEFWKSRKHRDGDRVCYYLTEYSKKAARPILREGLASDMYQRVALVFPRVVESVGPIRRQLKRSALNPPKVGRKIGSISSW
jgi:hypothetical protein